MGLGRGLLPADSVHTDTYLNTTTFPEDAHFSLRRRAADRKCEKLHKATRDCHV